MLLFQTEIVKNVSFWQIRVQRYLQDYALIVQKRPLFITEKIFCLEKSNR